jgi:hypothetical protein
VQGGQPAQPAGATQQQQQQQQQQQGNRNGTRGGAPQPDNRTWWQKNYMFVLAAGTMVRKGRRGTDKGREEGVVD